jgi:tRNA threonylcarbamoyladenosine biosynthesis protein TsaE
VEITYNINELDKAAQFILEHSTSKLLLFKAEMGTGKTTLIKQLISALGSSDDVSSPTFSIVNEYVAKTSKIFHFDLYRIKDEEELYDFGIETYLDTSHFVFVEWPELLEPLLDNDFTEIHIVLNENMDRVLTLKNSI